MTAVYGAIVVGIGAAVGSQGESGVVLTSVAAVIVAVAFQPMRLRAQSIGNRLVYEERASPYEVLSEFSDRLAGAYSTEDVLPRMVQIAAAGTGATRAQCGYRVGSTLWPAATWPLEGEPRTELDISRPDPSSGGLEAHSPGDVFAVGLAVREAAVQDPDPPIAEGSERLVIGLAGGTLAVVEDPRPG